MLFNSEIHRSSAVISQWSSHAYLFIYLFHSHFVMSHESERQVHSWDLGVEMIAMTRYSKHQYGCLAHTVECYTKKHGAKRAHLVFSETASSSSSDSRTSVPSIEY